MKYTMIVFFAVALTLTATAQTIPVDKVPAQVMAAYSAKFPKAEKARWEMEDAKEYEVIFTFNGTEHSALFDPDGKWVETESEISISSLPAAVTQSIAKQFGIYKIKKAETVERLSGTNYEVELVNEGKVKEVAFSAKGKIISKKSEKDEAEDDDD